MVVTKVLQIKRTDRLHRAVKYILNDAKTLELGQDPMNDFPVVLKDGQLYQQLISGNLIANPWYAADEMILTKKLADQRLGRSDKSDLVTGKGVLAHHIIQSFSPEDNLTPEEIHEIGRKTVLELTGGHYEMVMATHVDKDHIHNHIIFTTTNNTTLRKFRWQKGTKHALEKISDKHAEIAGAKIIDKEKPFDHTRYEAYQKKNVFKLEIKSRLEFLLKQSTSLDDFKAKAVTLDLAVDFSGKYAKYKLLDQPQERNTRDSSLSKKGRYSLEAIEERLSKNEVVLPLEAIKKSYQEEQEEKSDDFETRLTIESWQVAEETRTGIYLTVDYGVHNQGTIKIPYRQVEKKEDGNFEIFIKRSDFFYFLNPDKSENDRFVRGDTLVKQLAYDSGEYILRKHPAISKLDQLVKEFEFLSDHHITDSQQFQETADRFIKQLDETDVILEEIDQRMDRLNKISAALHEIQTENGSRRQAALAVLEEMKISPESKLAAFEKQLLELTVERNALKEKVDSLTRDYKTYEAVKENVKYRSDQSKSL